MAGTFTHWMIVESALRRFGELPAGHRLFPVLADRSDYVALGSIGPDYPYLAEGARKQPRGQSWAERMHCERTADFVVRGLENLQHLGGADFELALAWLCGFATHLVADTIVHPVVNATVGGLAQFQAREHHHCEMVQDCYLYHELTGLEIADGGHLSRLDGCSHPADPERLNPTVAASWTRTLRDNHPGAGASLAGIDPDGWHAHVSRGARALTDAGAERARENGQEPPAPRRSSELGADELERYVHAVRLPGGRTGHFQRDVFGRVVDEVLAVWGRLLADVARGDPEGCRAYLGNWDLDRGVDADAPYFWR